MIDEHDKSGMEAIAYRTGCLMVAHGGFRAVVNRAENPAVMPKEAGCCDRGECNT